MNRNHSLQNNAGTSPRNVQLWPSWPVIAVFDFLASCNRLAPLYSPLNSAGETQPTRPSGSAIEWSKCLGGKFRSSFEDRCLWVILDSSFKSPQFVRQSCLVDSQFHRLSQASKWGNMPSPDLWHNDALWQSRVWCLCFTDVWCHRRVMPYGKVGEAFTKTSDNTRAFSFIGGGDRVAVPQRITNDTIQLVSSTVRWWLVINRPFLGLRGAPGSSQERPSLLPVSTVAPIAGRTQNVPCRDQQGQLTHSALKFPNFLGRRLPIDRAQDPG